MLVIGKRTRIKIIKRKCRIDASSGSCSQKTRLKLIRMQHKLYSVVKDWRSGNLAHRSTSHPYGERDLILNSKDKGGVFVCQLGIPSLLSLMEQPLCQPSLEVSRSGLSGWVTWPAEVLSVRELRSQYPSRGAGDTHSLGERPFQQTAQPKWGNFGGLQ